VHVTTPSSHLKRPDGFTIIEVLAAMTVLLIGVFAAVALIDRANAATVTTRSREAATNVARELIEGARGVAYTALTPAAFEGQIQALPGLEDAGAPAGWTIRRRGFTFTVTATVCTVDDARDGTGPHDAGSFCAGSAAGTADRNPEDYKRVRVDVKWTQRGVDREVHQVELINNPGSAGGPAVRTLTLNGSATPPVVTSALGNQLTFQLTTSSTPATLHWLLDGASQAPITVGSGKAWSFDWPLGVADAAGSVVDGTYLVSAEAFDAYGVAGPSKSSTISINRTLPDKVTGFAGGRTGDPATPDQQVVDLEWLPSRERDIVGYTVQRVDGSGTTTVCDIKLQTSCIDRNPPNEATLTYYVYAWDTDSGTGGVRSGPQSDPLQVIQGNTPPHQPLHLQVVPLEDGTTELSWSRPVPDDDDPGDAIDFYRVYRDGITYDDRYARWSDEGATVTFIDGNTGGTSHTYWVTAVDRRFAESTPEGPKP
jgi:prepilin-type N-terminal cleavage/methylation domain-containing protein